MADLDVGQDARAAILSGDATLAWKLTAADLALRFVKRRDCISGGGTDLADVDNVVEHTEPDGSKTTYINHITSIDSALVSWGTNADIVHCFSFANQPEPLSVDPGTVYFFLEKAFNAEPFAAKTITDMPQILMGTRLGVAEWPGIGFHIFYVQDTDGQLMRADVILSGSGAAATAIVDSIYPSGAIVGTPASAPPGTIRHDGVTCAPVNENLVFVFFYRMPIVFVAACYTADGSEWTIGTAEPLVQRSDYDFTALSNADAELISDPSSSQELVDMPSYVYVLTLAAGPNGEAASCIARAQSPNPGPLVDSLSYSPLQWILATTGRDMGRRVWTFNLSRINERVWAVARTAIEGDIGDWYAYHSLLISSPDGIRWRDEGVLFEEDVHGQILPLDTGIYLFGNGPSYRMESNLLFNNLGVGNQWEIPDIVRAEVQNSGQGSTAQLTVEGWRVAGKPMRPGIYLKYELGAVLPDGTTELIPMFTGLIDQPAVHYKPGERIEQWLARGFFGRMVGETAYRPVTDMVWSSRYTFSTSFMVNKVTALPFSILSGTWDVKEDCTDPENPTGYARCTGSGIAMIPQIWNQPIVSMKAEWQLTYAGAFVFWATDGDNADAAKCHWRIGYRSSGPTDADLEFYAAHMVDGKEDWVVHGVTPIAARGDRITSVVDIRPGSVRLSTYSEAGALLDMTTVPLGVDDTFTQAGASYDSPMGETVAPASIFWRSGIWIALESDPVFTPYDPAQESPDDLHVQTNEYSEETHWLIQMEQQDEDLPVPPGWWYWSHGADPNTYGFWKGANCENPTFENCEAHLVPTIPWEISNEVGPAPVPEDEKDAEGNPLTHNIVLSWGTSQKHRIADEWRFSTPLKPAKIYNMVAVDGGRPIRVRDVLMGAAECSGVTMVTDPSTIYESGNTTPGYYPTMYNVDAFWWTGIQEGVDYPTMQIMDADHTIWLEPTGLSFGATSGKQHFEVPGLWDHTLVLLRVVAYANVVSVYRNDRIIAFWSMDTERSGGPVSITGDGALIVPALYWPLPEAMWSWNQPASEVMQQVLDRRRVYLIERPDGTLLATALRTRRVLIDPTHPVGEMTYYRRIVTSDAGIGDYRGVASIIGVIGSGTPGSKVYILNPILASQYGIRSTSIDSPWVQNRIDAMAEANRVLQDMIRMANTRECSGPWDPSGEIFDKFEILAQQPDGSTAVWRGSIREYVSTMGISDDGIALDGQWVAETVLEGE
jgi:hypothetical protein